MYSMDFEAFGFDQEAVPPKKSVKLQIIQVIGPKDCTLWDGYKELSARFAPSDPHHETIIGKRWSVIRIKEWKLVGAALYIIKAFEVVDKSPTEKITGKKASDSNATSGPVQIISGLTKGKLGLMRCVVMSLDDCDKTSSKGTVYRRMMAADITGSANVTFWKENTKQATDLREGDVIEIRNADVESVKAGYQYAATSTFCLMLNESALLTKISSILPIVPHQISLQAACQSGLGSEICMTVVLIKVGHVLNKKRVVEILDNSTDKTGQIELEGNIAYKITEEMVTNIITFLCLEHRSDRTFTARDCKSFFWSNMKSFSVGAEAIFNWAVQEDVLDVHRVPQTERVYEPDGMMAQSIRGESVTSSVDKNSQKKLKAPIKGKPEKRQSNKKTKHKPVLTDTDIDTSESEILESEVKAKKKTAKQTYKKRL